MLFLDAWTDAQSRRRYPVQLNRRSWQANGLRAWYSPGITHGGVRENWPQPFVVPFSGGGVPTPTPWGMALDCNATGFRGATTTLPERLKLGLPITLIAVLVNRATPDAYSTIFGAPYTTSDSSPWLCYVVEVNAVGHLSMASNSAGSFYRVNSIRPLTNYQDELLVLVGVLADGDQRIYANGEFLASEATSRSDPNYAATSRITVGVYIESGSFNIASDILEGRIYNRAFSAEEVAALSHGGWLDLYGPADLPLRGVAPAVEIDMPHDLVYPVAARRVINRVPY